MSAKQRIGIVGNGDAAKSVVRSFSKHSDVELVGAADPEPRARKRFEDDYGGETFVGIEELLVAGDLDGVYIATPTKLHESFVTMALEAGVHVLVEKPIAPTISATNAMISLADEKGLSLLVNHKRSVDPPILAMYQIIQSGQLGRVRAVHRWHFTDWFYRPRGEDERDPAAGGVVLRQGAHEFDIIRLLTAGSPALSIRGTVGDYDQERQGEGAYYSWVNYGGGLIASSIYGGYGHFSSSEFISGPSDALASGVSRQRLVEEAPTAEVEAELKRQAAGSQVFNSHGTYGYTLVNCELGDMRPTEQGTVWVYTDEGRREASTTAISGVDSVVAEFSRAIAKSTPPLHDGAWGLACLEQCLAVRESSATGEETQLVHQGNIDDAALMAVIGDGVLEWR